MSSKLAWEGLVSRAIVESPETVFDWAILGAQGAGRNTEEEMALEGFFESRLKPHSKSTPQKFFSDLESYQDTFQWLIVEEARAICEGLSLSVVCNAYMLSVPYY